MEVCKIEKWTHKFRKFVSLEVYKTMCDDDKSGGLEVWKFGGLHIVCDVDKFGSLQNSAYMWWW